MRKPQSVSFYSLGCASIFTVSREGDDLFGQISGQRKLRLAAAAMAPFPTGAGRPDHHGRRPGAAAGCAGAEPEWP